VSLLNSELTNDKLRVVANYNQRAKQNVSRAQEFTLHREVYCDFQQRLTPQRTGWTYYYNRKRM